MINRERKRVMYTVIAIDSNLESKLIDYLPLLKKTINNDIDIISWNRKGRSLNSAFVNLKDIVESKENWQLIIISDDTDNTNNNPFDVSYYDKASDFIYSAQLFGHVPPITNIKPVIEKDEVKYVSSIEKIENNHELKDMNIAYPENVILLAVTKEDENTAKVNKQQFWDECSYPSNCRFLKYNFLNKYDYVSASSKLELIFLIHTLSVNKISSNDIQAYTLYDVCLDINGELMYEVFNQYYNQLFRLSNDLNKMKKESKETKYLKINDLKDLNLNVDINVKMEYQDDHQLYVNKDNFSIFKDKPVIDSNEWDLQRADIDERLKRYLKIPQRSIKSALLKVQTKASEPIKENNIYLDDFQKEDLQNYLEDLEIQLVDSLPKQLGDLYNNDNIETIDTKVRSYMKKRPYFLVTIICLVTGILFYLIGFVPMIMQGFKHGIFNITIILILIFIGMLVISVVFLLGYKYFKFINLVSEFNQIMNNIINKIDNNSTNYSTYLSILFSLIKARRFQSNFINEESVVDENQIQIDYKINEVTQSMQDVSIWNQATSREFVISYDVSDNQDVDQFAFDENLDTDFVFDREYRINLNHGRNYLITPFKFIEQIYITKGERK